MTKPAINRSELYAVIADTLPMEGRDYTIDTAADNDGNAVVILTPITAAGRGFVPAAVERLSSGKHSFSVRANGIEEQEIETVTTIRARIEREEDEAMRVRLSEAAEEERVANAALELAKKEKNGVEKAYRDVVAVHKKISTYSEAAGLVRSLRESVEEIARKEAESDAEKGQSWSVDINAPLTTLFDRQDVGDKMRAKESRISDAAINMARANLLKIEAAGFLKQYISQKKDK